MIISVLFSPECFIDALSRLCMSVYYSGHSNTYIYVYWHLTEQCSTEHGKKIILLPTEGRKKAAENKIE